MEVLAFIPACHQKGGVQLTSFLFVSVPLGPVLWGFCALAVASVCSLFSVLYRLHADESQQTHQYWLLGEQLQIG